MKCDHVWLKEDGEPESCSYGLPDGAAAIGKFCPKNKRKIRQMRKKSQDDKSSAVINNQ